MLHIPPTNCLLLTAKQEPYKKAYLLTKKIGRIFWKKSSAEWTSRKKKYETERGLGRRTREEIVKWNQTRAPRFQTGETSDIPGLPSGASNNRRMQPTLLTFRT